MSDNLMIKAMKAKLTFENPRGIFNVQDLVQMKSPELTAMALVLKKQLPQVDVADDLAELGLSDEVTPDTKEVEALKLKLEVVVCIAKYNKALETEAAATRDRKAEKAKLMRLLESKEEEALANLSADEIKARLAALD